MFIQSIFVYSTLMMCMMLFGYSASYRVSAGIDITQSYRYGSFWRFNTLFPLFLFALVIGMRYDVGVDHLSYLEGYLYKIYVGKKEPLFYMFSDLGWYFNFHYVVYFALIAFAQVFFFFYAFKDERFLFPLLVFFIFTNGDISFWMNGIRQALAMTVWIASLRYIEDKKLVKYLIFGAMAFMIHRSAFILVLMYPLLRNGRDYFKNIPLQLVLLLSAFVINSLFYNVFMKFDSLVTTYTSMMGEELYSTSYSTDKLIDSFKANEGTGLAYLFKIVLNIVIIIFSTKLKVFYNSKRFNIIYFFFFIGLLTSYMFPAGFISFTRPFRYFYIFQSIMYAYFGYYLLKNKSKKLNMFILIGMIAAFVGIFILSQYSATENSHSLFQFYFEHPEVYGYPNKN